MKRGEFREGKERKTSNGPSSSHRCLSWVKTRKSKTVKAGSWKKDQREKTYNLVAFGGEEQGPEYFGSQLGKGGGKAATRGAQNSKTRVGAHKSRSSRKSNQKKPPPKPEDQALGRKGGGGLGGMNIGHKKKWSAGNSPRRA